MNFDQITDDIYKAVERYCTRRIESEVGSRVKAAIEELRQGLPPPALGQPGADGRDGVDGKDGLSGERGEKGEPGEKGEEGQPGPDGLAGNMGDMGQKGDPGTDGRDGRDGPPGRDVLQLEILPAIDANKNYARGRYAKHAGGLWRSFETTEGMRGWECVIEGRASVEIEGDLRGFTIRDVSSTGKVTERTITVPAMIYRGVFDEAKQYEPGDTVTWGGSLFHCNEITNEKPETGKAWTLAAKRGRDAK